MGRRTTIKQGRFAQTDGANGGSSRNLDEDVVATVVDRRDREVDGCFYGLSREQQ